MRIILGFLIISIFTCPGLAAQAPPYPHWKIHKIKNGEWLYQLSRNLQKQNIKVLSIQDLVQRILKRNPHIKNPNQIDPGTEIFLPYEMSDEKFHDSRSPAANVNPNAKIVNNHYYYNSTVYQNNGEDKNTPLSRGPSHFSPPPVKLPMQTAPKRAYEASDSRLKQSALVRKKRNFDLSVESFFQFSKLTATENADGSKASLTTDSSLGLMAGFTHKLFKKYKLQYFLSFTQESFSKPQTALNTEDFEQNYLQAGVALVWNVIHNLNLSPFVGYREKAYINATNSNISVIKVGHPLLGLNANYELFSWGTNQIVTSAYFSYFLPESGENFTVNSGLSAGLGLSYGYQLFGQSLMTSTWARNQDSKTNATEQSSQDVGLSLSWYISL